MVHSPFHHLSKKVRNNRLQNGRTSVTINKLSLRAASRLHDVLCATLRRYLLFDRNISVQGRRPCLELAKEKIIADAALEFARNGTPLSRECLKDFMQHFIRRLPLQRRTTLLFRECRPGDRYLKSFMTQKPFHIREANM